jgi:protein gp37
MNKTKIEWCDMTWNPVTGCQNKCVYCYARNIANRFGGTAQTKYARYIAGIDGYEIISRHVRDDGSYSSFPFGFKPTFHTYRLDEPTKIKHPQNIFVCSMADLFGDWVPDEWIKTVFNHCYLAPQHTFLFLTKNPGRYYDVIEYLETDVKNYTEPPGIFLGATATNYDQLNKAYESPATWISIEPLQEEIYTDNFVGFLPSDSCEIARWSWVVIGAETGNRKDKIIPKRKWIKEIVECCRFWETPVFLKNSLAEIWGEPLIQEYPWKAPENAGADA